MHTYSNITDFVNNKLVSGNSGDNKNWKNNKIVDIQEFYVNDEDRGVKKYK